MAGPIDWHIPLNKLAQDVVIAKEKFKTIQSAIGACDQMKREMQRQSATQVKHIVDVDNQTQEIIRRMKRQSSIGPASMGDNQLYDSIMSAPHPSYLPTVQYLRQQQQGQPQLESWQTRSLAAANEGVGAVSEYQFAHSGRGQGHLDQPRRHNRLSHEEIMALPIDKVCAKGSSNMFLDDQEEVNVNKKVKPEKTHVKPEKTIQKVFKQTLKANANKGKPS